MNLVNRAGPASVALETTLPVHGVPKGHGAQLIEHLAAAVIEEDASPAFVGIHHGRPVVGLNPRETADLLADPGAVPKANTANLGLLIHRGSHGATTVSATVELAAAAGIRMVATGGLGGVHRDYARRLDVSADLAALARFPVAVVTSGVKSILDVEATRELIEAMGVPVVGFGTDDFPAFYLRSSGARVDARFDDSDDLARFIAAELTRAGRGIVVANPVPQAQAVSPQDWQRWLDEAARGPKPESGRDVTPVTLARLHEVSGGATLRANVALALGNARLAARLCRRLAAVGAAARS
jgi:pseudouridine-5'-phosphate glycosidase